MTEAHHTDLAGYQHRVVDALARGAEPPTLRASATPDAGECPPSDAAHDATPAMGLGALLAEVGRQVGPLSVPCPTCGSTGVYADREEDPDAPRCLLTRLDEANMEPGEGCHRCPAQAEPDRPRLMETGRRPAFFQLERPGEAVDVVLCTRCAWGVEDAHGTPCPRCHPRPTSGRGILYVYQGMAGTSIVADTDCGVLAYDVDAIGDRCDDLGLDEPPGPGLWKVLVEAADGHCPWTDEYDLHFRTIGEWVMADGTDEPRCARATSAQHETCSGAPTRRGDGADAPWACDRHAPEVT